MDSEIDIKNLSRPEKIRMMEALWEDLSREDHAVVSPDWHETALRETEQHVSANKEKPVDWDDAKKDLRKRLG